MTELSSFTTQQLEYFATWKDKENSPYVIQKTDDNKLVILKRKFNQVLSDNGMPILIETASEVIAHIDISEFKTEVDNCLKRIELIRNFAAQEGLSVV